MLLPLLLLVGSGIFCQELRINDASKLVEFSSNVNNGTNYTGTTVLLESDIALTDELLKDFEPIGKNESYSFLGTFDGQGHIISNLVINFSSSYTGLFGYSDGITIKNVVMDSSCSVTNSYNLPQNCYIGGIIGKCNSNFNSCLIKTIVCGSFFK